MVSLHQQVLQKIRPSRREEQHFRKVTQNVVRQLQTSLPLAKVIVGGSGAKGTWLAGTKEVDVFVAFVYAHFAERSGDLSALLHQNLRKAFPGKKIVRLHGSRDYFQMQQEGWTFEFVPILHLRKASEAKNITDVSPLHALWVNAHVKKKEEVLLAKQFCKAQRAYGAESYIGGFSGYVLEILVATYGSFEKLLKAAASWRPKEVIDPARHYRKRDPLFELNQSKVRSPLVVIDPVDKNRNAAAALTMETFLRFKKAAQTYLQKPSEEFFLVRDQGPTEWKRKAAERKMNLVQAQVVMEPGKKDVVGSRMVKIFTFLGEKLQPFGVKESGWMWNYFFYLVERKLLPAEEVKKGPPLEMEEAVKAFRKKHRSTFVQQGRVMATVQVKYPTVEQCIQAAVKETYVKERVKRVAVNVL